MRLAPKSRQGVKRRSRGKDRAELYRLSGSSMSDQSLVCFLELVSLSKNTVYAKQLRDAALASDWSTLLSISRPNPASYEDAVSFGIDYMLSEVLSKMGPGSTGARKEDLVRVAMDKFKVAEDQCAETNLRILHKYKLLGSAELDPLVSRIQKKIAWVLGRFDWDEISSHFAHGSGATTRLTKKCGDAYYKFRDSPDTTKECETLSKIAISMIKPWQEAEPGSTWSDCRTHTVVGNRITTVPKTAKTDRVIAKEPCMNIYIQKGIGRVIRSRLRHAGVNLNDQSRNQHLARDGSASNSLATLDLSNASDTIATEVVRLLLPPEWYEPLNMVRSHYGVKNDGSVIRYQKFSTMGNGFTFELESLIFWAICSSVVDILNSTDKRIGVYGDDLIVDANAYELLVYTLNQFGFTTNGKKSYMTGPFRESCGKHWFLGRDVTPFYIREGIEGILAALLCTNNVRRWMNRLYDGFIPPQAWSVYTRIRDILIPKYVQDNYKIPDGFGDMGVVSSFSEALPQRAAFGWEGWVTPVLGEIQPSSSRTKSRRKTGRSLMAKSLAKLDTVDRHGLAVLGFGRMFSPVAAPEGAGVASDQLPFIDQRLRLKRSKLIVSRWVDVGYPLA